MTITEFKVFAAEEKDVRPAAERGLYQLDKRDERKR
jgi:hypothetical protein